MTESFEAVKMAQNAGYKTVISHRSGETADTFIADIAVSGRGRAGLRPGLHAGQNGGGKNIIKLA